MRLTLFFTRGVSLKDWVETGIVTREVALYRRLLERGAAVDFVTYGGQEDIALGREHAPGIRILTKWLPISDGRFERYAHLIHAPQLWGTSVVKTNQVKGGVAARNTARRWCKPLIARCGYLWSDFVEREHGSGSVHAHAALEAERLLFSQADAVVVTAEPMAASIRQRLPEANIRLIPNYVDTDLFCPDEMRAPGVDVVFVGRLEAQKNAAALLEAIKMTGASALIVGEGSLREELQAQAEGRPIEFAGRTPHEHIPALLHRARIFVLPSHYEGHPKTLIEAMAAGLPVLAGDSPGIRGIIEHGETGWLTATDPHSIAEGLRTLLADPDLCRHLAAQGREFALTHYSLDRIVEQEYELLCEVTA